MNASPSEQFPDPFLDEETSAAWHSALRQRDWDDIASGRRTPEEVQRENSWLIPNVAEAKILNLYEACALL